jgi:hypothetical protein
MTCQLVPPHGGTSERDIKFLPEVFVRTIPPHSCLVVEARGEKRGVEGEERVHDTILSTTKSGRLTD